MRESRKYLLFFKTYLFLIVLPTIIGLMLGLGFFLGEPKITSVKSLLELNFSQPVEIGARSALADELVGLLRSENLQKLIIRDNQNIQISVYKPGPISIAIEVRSADKEVAGRISQDLKQVIKVRVDYKIIGEEIVSKKFSKISLGLFLLPSIIGFLVGLLSSLIKSYFKNY